MTKCTRFLAAVLSFALASGPGLAHASGVAAVRAARMPVRAPGASVGVVGAHNLRLNAPAGLPTLNAAVLSGGVSAAPSAQVAPTARAFAPSLAVPESPTVSAARTAPNAVLSAPNAAGEIAAPGAARAAAASISDQAPRAAPQARRALAAFAKTLTPRAGAAARAAASSRAFDNAAVRHGGVGAAVQGRLGTGRGALLARDRADVAAAPGEAAREPTAPKKTGIGRSLKLGWLTAIGMLFLYTAVDLGAALFGYQFTPSYTMPEIGGEAGAFSWLATMLDTFMAAVMAPLNEEVYFRAGLMGLLAMGATSSLTTLHKIAMWATKRWQGAQARVAGLKRFINPAVFWYAGLVTAFLFVIVHETSDPILLTTRMIQAVIMGWLFAREGILSAIFHHGFFNLLAGTLFFSMIALPSGAIAIALWPALLLFAAYGLVLAYSWIKTRRGLARENREIKAGARAPYRLTARGSLILGLISLAAVFIAGYPGMMWGSGMLIGMAIQMAPAAGAFFVYAASLRDYKESYGEARLREKVTQPAEKYAMFNMPGLVAAVKTYLGLLAGIIGLGLGMNAGLPILAPVLALASLLPLAAQNAAKKFAWKSVWGVLYTVLIAGALGVIAGPFAEPAIEIILEMAQAMQAAAGQ